MDIFFLWHPQFAKSHRMLVDFHSLYACVLQEPTCRCGKQASPLEVLSSPDSRRSSDHAPGGEEPLVDCQGERVQRLSVKWKSTRGVGARIQNGRSNGGMIVLLSSNQKANA
jgi:hypothetical protein